MSDWRQSGMRPLIDRKKGCRGCPTSGELKKLHDAISKVQKKMQDIRSKNKKQS